LKLVTVLLPEAYLEGLDELVRSGMYPSRSAAIRAAVRDMLKKELWATSINDEDTRRTIQSAWQENRLLLEPHGATGWLGLRRYLDENPSSTTAVSIETAHPAKFPEEIEKLLGFSPETPASLARVEQKKEDYLKMPADYGAFRKLILEKYSS